MRTLLTAALFITAAYAGPPMICHEVHIGNEKSLPWGVSNDWDSRLPSYDRGRLLTDTLALLQPETPVLARMETLRRAAIYAGATPLASQLADALVNRTGPLASFDAGYFIEAVHQLEPINKSDPLAGRDGYSLARKSLANAADTAAIEYGLSLMQAHHSWPNEHFRKAKAGAKPGSLLDLNVKQFEN
jgi:hypothetical protein